MATVTPNYAQIPPNSSGLKIATTEITDTVGNVVELQNTVISDPATAGYNASVSYRGELSVIETQSVLLGEVVAQLKRIARLLEISFDVEVSIDDAA